MSSFGDRDRTPKPLRTQQNFVDQSIKRGSSLVKEKEGAMQIQGLVRKKAT